MVEAAPLVVHYWADLQSGYGLRCYGNITGTLGTKLASILRYDDIVRTAGWAGSARVAGRRPAGDGGTPKTARRIREAGAAGPPATGRRRGAFSTLLRKSGMRASTSGVLATKSEHKMLASTRLYSLYAWFALCCHSNATRTPIANPPNSEQLGGQPLPCPQVTSGSVQ